MSLADQLTPDALRETVEKLHRSVEDLRTRVDAASAKRDDLQEQTWELEDEVETVQAENERLREENEQQAGEIDMLRREYKRLARRLTAVEEEQGIDPATAGAYAQGKQTSPLYLLETIGPEAIADAPSERLYRARILLENRDRWGEERTNAKFGRHRLLATQAHDLKQRLEDARDEELQWGQVYPALRKLASLGGGHVQFVESYESAEQDYGKAVVWQEVDG